MKQIKANKRKSKYKFSSGCLLFCSVFTVMHVPNLS